MPENPYAAPKTDSPVAPELAVVDELRAIGSYQRWIQICILLEVIAYVLMIPQVSFSVGPAIVLVAVVVFWLSALAGTVLAILLALRVYNVVVAVIFGFFTIWPCIGLICLFAINQRATARLQEFQIPVGLLGADMEELEKRVQQIQQYGLPPTPPAA